MEPVTKLPNSTGCQMPEIPFREPGVLAADLYLTTEAEVVTDEDPRACNKTVGIRHVVAVADSHDPTEVRAATVWQGDGHHAEVSGSFVAEGMGLLKDGKPARFELGFHLGQDFAMTERIPCLGSRWCRDRKEILAADGLSSAVKQHSPRGSIGAGCRWFDDVHRCISETTKAGDIAAPGPCCCRSELDDLERAQRLVDGLDFFSPVF